MPRTLPWLVQRAEKPERRSKPSPQTLKRKRQAPPNNEEELVASDPDDIRAEPAPRRDRRDLNRTPSTSPPPAPPEVEYMREGYDGDDIWMMVEDEFYSTAQLFTKHIHHAEYVRLKNLAQARGERIVTGTAGPTEKGAVRSGKAEARVRRFEKAIDHTVEHDTDDEEDAYMMDARLAGLMTTMKKVSHDLSTLAKTKPNTKAAAGFFNNSPAVHQQTAESSLGTAAISETQHNSTAGVQPVKEYHNDKDNLNAECEARTMHDSVLKSPVPPMSSHGFFKPFAHGSPTSASAQRPLAKPDVQFDDVESNDFNTRRRAAIELLAKRRAEREARQQREEGRKGKAKSMVEVPTFLI